MALTTKKMAFVHKLPLPCWPTLLLVCFSWLPYLRLLSKNSFGDEGLIAQSALRISQGQVPFRDFFSAIAPGSYYFYAALFTLFEPSFLVLRLGVMLVALLLLLSTWLVLVRLNVRSSIPYLVTASFLAYFGGPAWFIASHHWLAATCCIAACAFLIPADGSDSPALKDVAFSGLLSALATSVLQHRGGIWIIAVSPVFLLLPRERRLPTFAAYWCGIAAFAVPAALYFIATAGWDTLRYDLITFPLNQYHQVDEHRPALISQLVTNWHNFFSEAETGVQPRNLLWAISRTGGLIALCIICLLPCISVIQLNKLRRLKRFRLYTLACLGACLIASYLATLHRFSIITLIFASSAAIIVFAISLDAHLHDRNITAKFAGWILITWVTLFTIIAAGYSSAHFLSPKTSLPTPAGTVQIRSTEETETVRGIATFAKATWQPGETVFCYPYSPLYYFIFRLTNPTPFDTLTWPMHTAQQFQQTQHLLDRSKCRWLILNEPKIKTPLPLEQYFAGQYRVRYLLTNVILLERHPLLPP